MRRILVFLGMAFLFSQAVAAEEITLTTYNHAEAPNTLDVAPTGPSIGDIYTRHGTLHYTPDGPAIGKYYTQAIIVFVDPENRKSVRSYLAEAVFEDGTIYMTDLVDVDHSRPVEVEHIHTGAVIGGTGSYSGARGTYTVEVRGGISKRTIIYSLPN